MNSWYSPDTIFHDVFDLVVLLHCTMVTVFSFQYVGHKVNVLLQIYNLEF